MADFNAVASDRVSVRLNGFFALDAGDTLAIAIADVQVLQAQVTAADTTALAIGDPRPALAYGPVAADSWAVTVVEGAGAFAVGLAVGDWTPQFISTTPSTAWDASGVGNFDATKVNDGVATAKAFDVDQATGGAWVRFDSGIGLANEFVSATVTTGSVGAVDNATWAVEYSDDLAAWTRVASGFVTGGSSPRVAEWRPAGQHRAWRLFKTDGPTAGPEYDEVAWTRAVFGLGLALTDSDANRAQAFASDALALAATESTATTVPIRASDVDALVVADAGAAIVAGLVALFASDSLATQAGDLGVPRASIQAADALAPQLAEAAVSLLAKVAPVDQFAVVLGDPRTFPPSQVQDLGEAFGIGFADSALAALRGAPQIITAGDAVAPAVGDLPIGIERDSKAEAVAVGVTESVVAGPAVRGSEAFAAGLADTALVAVVSLSVVGSDAVAATASDAGSVSISGLVTAAASDAAGVAAGDAPAVVAQVAVSESLAVAASDIGVIVVSGLVVVSAGDLGGAAVAEATSLMATLAVTDADGVVIGDVVRVLRADTSTTDALAPVLSDLGASLPNVPLLSLGATEVVAAGLSDVGAAIVTQDAIFASDAVGAGLVEAVAQLVGIVSADAVAVTLAEIGQLTIAGLVLMAAQDQDGFAILDGPAGQLAAVAADEAIALLLADAGARTVDAGDVTLAAADAVAAQLDDVTYAARVLAQLAVADPLPLLIGDAGLRAIDAGDVALGAADPIRLPFDDEATVSIVSFVFDIDAFDQSAVTITDGPRSLTVAQIAASDDEVTVGFDDLGAQERYFNRLRLVLIATADLASGRRTLERVH